MRRYRLAVHVLVILSVFVFLSALAAPIAVQEVRKAFVDVADEGEVVAIVSGKRADQVEESLLGSFGSVPASPDTGSMESTSLSPPSSPTTSEYASMFNHDFKWTPNTEIQPWSPEDDMPLDQPKPESKSILGNMAHIIKSLWGKLTSASKSLVSEMWDFHR